MFGGSAGNSAGRPNLIHVALFVGEHDAVVGQDERQGMRVAAQVYKRKNSWIVPVRP
jgi:hypothetical protein